MEISGTVELAVSVAICAAAMMMLMLLVMEEQRMTANGGSCPATSLTASNLASFVAASLLCRFVHSLAGDGGEYRGGTTLAQSSV